MRTETVAESFGTYRDRVLPKAAPAVQVLETQRAFYAGAYFLLMNLAYNIGDDSTDEEEGIRNLEALKAEIETFGATGGLPLPTAVPPMPPDTAPRYTIPDPHDIQPILKELGAEIAGRLPTGFGFNLILAEFGPGGGLFYISNVDRPDAIAMLREFISRQTQ